MQEFTDVLAVLTVGTKMFISMDNDNSISDEIMHSVLKGVGQKELVLSLPVKNGSYYPIPKDSKIEVYFYQGSGRYYFKTTVSGRIIYEARPVLKCLIPNKMIRTERRDYYRVDVLFHIKISTFQESKRLTRRVLYKDEYNVCCIDISGGGFQLHPAYSELLPFKVGMNVEIDFCEVLPGLTKAMGVVSREHEKGRSGWGVRFTNISEANRNRIIKYVFKRQLEKNVTKYKD